MAQDPTSDALLNEVVRRIVSVHPQSRIVLLGSRARGTATGHSDYDLVVVTADLRDDEPPSARVRKALRDIDASLDLIVLTPEEWDHSRRVPGSVLREADATGRVLHAAA